MGSDVWGSSMSALNPKPLGGLTRALGILISL